VVTAEADQVVRVLVEAVRVVIVQVGQVAQAVRVQVEVVRVEIAPAVQERDNN